MFCSVFIFVFLQKQSLQFVEARISHLKIEIQDEIQNLHDSKGVKVLCTLR